VLVAGQSGSIDQVAAERSDPAAVMARGRVEHRRRQKGQVFGAEVRAFFEVHRNTAPS
jgi:hypothetical protein